jgi:hypothetical protein
MHFSRSYDGGAGAADVSGSVFSIYARGGVPARSRRSDRLFGDTGGELAAHGRLRRDQRRRQSLCRPCRAGTSNASSLRAGASWTRHITPSVDAAVSAAIGRTFGEAPILADVDFIGPAVGATDDVTFGQFGARLGVKLNDSMTIGTMTGHVLYTPGHTPACTTHVIGNAAFVGDTLFMPDAGSGRADFPGGDAATLYHSIQRLLTLPDEMRLFMCHDYGPNGRDIRWETTVGEERRHNVHVRDGVSEAEFVAMRQARDATLAMPRLIIPSLQVNMRAGQLPRKDDAGKTFLKVPVNEL